MRNGHFDRHFHRQQPAHIKNLEFEMSTEVGRADIAVFIVTVAMFAVTILWGFFP